MLDEEGVSIEELGLVSQTRKNHAADLMGIVDRIHRTEFMSAGFLRRIREAKDPKEISKVYGSLKESYDTKSREKVFLEATWLEMLRSGEAEQIATFSVDEYAKAVENVAGVAGVTAYYSINGLMRDGDCSKEWEWAELQSQGMIQEVRARLAERVKNKEDGDTLKMRTNLLVSDESEAKDESNTVHGLDIHSRIEEPISAEWAKSFVENPNKVLRGLGDDKIVPLNISHRNGSANGGGPIIMLDNFPLNIEGGADLDLTDGVVRITNDMLRQNIQKAAAEKSEKCEN